MTKYVKQATKFAAAVEKLTGVKPPVWDKDTCEAKGYRGAQAGVVMEETGVGAFNDTTILWDSGYGREAKLEGMTEVEGVFAEPYANWLLLFYPA